MKLMSERMHDALRYYAIGARLCIITQFNEQTDTALLKRGLIETVPGFNGYRITPAGRSIISEAGE